MSLKDIVREMLEAIQRNVAAVDDETVDRLAEEIRSHPRTFVVGMGRSRLVAQMFAMRLVQMGLESYVIGDALTPAIVKDDLLIAISGSGRTWFTYHATQEAKKLGVRTVVLTAKRDSPITAFADLIVHLPAKTKYDLQERDVAPLGTEFELSSLVFLDALVAYMQKKYGISEKQMFERHAVIE